MALSQELIFADKDIFGSVGIMLMQSLGICFKNRQEDSKLAQVHFQTFNIPVVSCTILISIDNDKQMLVCNRSDNLKEI